MPVEDKYINEDVKFLDNQNNQGAKTKKSIVSFEIAAADDDGSVYRVFKNIQANQRLTKVTIMCDAITNGTDFDLGYYKKESGAAVDADALLDGGDFSSASRAIDGMSAVVIEDIGKRHYELAGETYPDNEAVYDIALTANTVGTAAGTVTVIMEQSIA